MSDAGPVAPVGVPLTCKHCRHGEFVYRRVQLNTRLLSFFDLDWLNASADVYVCTRCGFLHWFLPDAVESPELGQFALREPLSAEMPSTAIECLACGATIPANSSTCPQCGWSYETPEPEAHPG